MLIARKIFLYLIFLTVFATIQYLLTEKVCCTYAQVGPFEKVGQVGWINEDEDTLSVSIETNEPISGNGSLRVDVKPASSVNETVYSPWMVISTDFIPVNGYQSYQVSLDVSARDVNRLHSKIYYYDAHKIKIEHPLHYFVFCGKNDTFKDTFTASIISPNDAEYLKFQMWVRKSLEPSSYLIDNIKIEKVDDALYPIKRYC